MSDLATYRSEINDIDEQIMTLIGKRQACVIKIAHLKGETEMTAHQPVRHRAVIKARRQLAAEHGLNPAMVTAIWKMLMDEAIRIQESIIRS